MEFARLRTKGEHELWDESEKVAVPEHNRSQSAAQYSFCPWAIRIEQNSFSL